MFEQGDEGLRVVARVAVAAVVGAMVAISGCAGQDPGPSPQRIDERRADGLTVYVHRDASPMGLLAEVVGKLAVREPGCVVLDQGDGRWYPVVWPAGTDLASGEPLAVELPNGEKLTVGRLVRGAGGYQRPESLGIEVPEACLPSTREVATFNSGDTPSTG